MSIKDYGFRPGKLFLRKEAESPLEYLETAEKIHEYLEEHKKETEDGIYWQDTVSLLGGNNSGDLSQYGGSSGALYFYLNLYMITGKEIYKDLVLKASDYLSINWRKQKDIIKSGDFAPKGVEYSFYIGTAGIGAVLSRVYETFRREKDRKTVADITDDIIAGAYESETGLAWAEDKSPLLGGGTVLYLFRIYDFLKKPEILEAAKRGADTILAEAQKDPRGGLAWRSYAHPGQTRVPNFECGTAGVGYILTYAYEVSGDEKYLSAAKEAAEHLKAIAVKQGDGFLIPWHDNPEEETIFYVSTCHGPAGTSRLFYQLYRHTGDRQYLDDIGSLYSGLRHIGVPEKQSAGYWNTVGICCGTAGIVQFLINYSLVTGREDVKETLKVAGSILLGQQETQKNGVAWPLAFERVKPDRLSRGISYSAGVSGVGAALLQLYLFEEGKYSWTRLFDDPYPEH